MNASQITNKHFSVIDQIFIKSCLLAGIPTTTRQASKFRRKTGKAYTQVAEAKIAIRSNTAWRK